MNKVTVPTNIDIRIAPGSLVARNDNDESYEANQRRMHELEVTRMVMRAIQRAYYEGIIV